MSAARYANMRDITRRASAVLLPPTPAERGRCCEEQAQALAAAGQYAAANKKWLMAVYWYAIARGEAVQP